MKILIFGPKARYDAYRPDFVAGLPVEEVYCPLDRDKLPEGDVPSALRSITFQAAADHPDTQVIFSAIIGLFLFGQFPDHWSILGYGIIIGVSAYSFFRENPKILSKHPSSPQ